MDDKQTFVTYHLQAYDKYRVWQEQRARMKQKYYEYNVDGTPMGGEGSLFNAILFLMVMFSLVLYRFM